jgi:VDE lipocalin domain
VEVVPVAAADTAAVGKCLLGNCPKELGACLADPSCVQNLLCLQKCNGLDRDAESKCQVSVLVTPGCPAGQCAIRRHPSCRQVAAKQHFPRT